MRPRWRQRAHATQRITLGLPVSAPRTAMCARLVIDGIFQTLPVETASAAPSATLWNSSRCMVFDHEDRFSTGRRERTTRPGGHRFYRRRDTSIFLEVSLVALTQSTMNLITCRTKPINISTKLVMLGPQKTHCLTLGLPVRTRRTPMRARLVVDGIFQALPPVDAASAPPSATL